MNCNPLAVPADPCVKLSPQMSPQNEEEKQEMTYVPFLQKSAISFYLRQSQSQSQNLKINDLSRDLSQKMT